MKRLLVVILVLAAVWAFGGESLLWACPNCKDAVVDATGKPTNGLAAGFNFSILTMLAVPYLMVGIGIFSVRHSIRRAQAQKQARQAVQPQTVPTKPVPPSVVAES